VLPPHVQHTQIRPPSSLKVTKSSLLLLNFKPVRQQNHSKTPVLRPHATPLSSTSSSSCSTNSASTAMNASKPTRIYSILGGKAFFFFTNCLADLPCVYPPSLEIVHILGAACQMLLRPLSSSMFKILGVDKSGQLRQHRLFPIPCPMMSSRSRFLLGCLKVRTVDSPPLEARRIFFSENPVLILSTLKLSSSLQVKTLALGSPFPATTGIHLASSKANHGPSVLDRPVQVSLVMPLHAHSRSPTIS